MSFTGLRPFAATALVGVLVTVAACGGDEATSAPATDAAGSPDTDEPDSDAVTVASTAPANPDRSETGTTAPATSGPAVTAPVATAQPTTPTTQAPWEDPTGTYRVAYPVEPNEQRLQAPLPDGTTMPVIAYLAELGGATAITSCTDLPDGEEIDPVPVLDAARDSALANFGAELVEFFPIELQGRAGSSYRGAIGEAGAVLGRTFLDGLQLCNAIVVGEPASVDAAGPPFLDSFQFLQENA